MTPSIFDKNNSILGFYMLKSDYSEKSIKMDYFLERKSDYKSSRRLVVSGWSPESSDCLLSSMK